MAAAGCRVRGGQDTLNRSIQHNNIFFPLTPTDLHTESLFFPSPSGRGWQLRCAQLRVKLCVMKHKYPAKTNPAKKIANYLRKHQTPAERKLWSALRNRQIENIKFRRQHPIGKYIVDFYCDSQKLVIEIDGETHVERREYDQERTKYLQLHKYRVIRFTNSEVLQNLEQVVLQILSECDIE